MWIGGAFFWVAFPTSATPARWKSPLPGAWRLQHWHSGTLDFCSLLTVPRCAILFAVSVVTPPLPFERKEVPIIIEPVWLHKLLKGFKLLFSIYLPYSLVLLLAYSAFFLLLILLPGYSAHQEERMVYLFSPVSCVLRFTKCPTDMRRAVAGTQMCNWN